ncbi:hypothetical protein BaRGS_00026291, partial [Batillaria attramentaria]
TKSGDVLVSVNPFKPMPNLFGDEAHQEYSLESLSKSTDPHPHVYWLASLAARRRVKEKVDQVVLVSGESGAGKTEATKLMVKHILYLSPSHTDQGLYDSIDQVNPLIELFGNARTVLNENSSRFAKFLEIKFSPDGAVTGAVIRDYILEKSRVVCPSEGESNFHIFYTFLDDVMKDPKRQEQFLMEGMDKYTDFRIVPQFSWHQHQFPMDGQTQRDVFREIGMSQEEVDNLHIILAAILHLTNIRFVDDDESSAGGVVVDNDDAMYKAACLLSVEPETLARVLVTTKKKLGGEVIDTPKSRGRAEGGRDAMAKALYERLFGWLIRRINMALNRTHSTEAGIGFLDICGFENLRGNSLEQLCINLANEHLQSFMNRQVFEHEMNIYRQEGLDLGHVDPPSNEELLLMFNRPREGILDLINEDTRIDISSDQGLVRKLTARHAGSEHYNRYKNDEPRFGITHFAGPVWYSARDFLEKNRDMVGDDITKALVASSNELISDIFQVKKAPTGSISVAQFQYRMSTKHTVRFKQPGQLNLSASVVRGLRQSLKDRFGTKLPKMQDPEISKLSDQRTVIDHFQASMKELLGKMKQAQPFFVRCIKPNDQQAPDQFVDMKVRQQLKYNGITEIARIRRVWFPVRVATEIFIQRYCDVVPDSKLVTDKKNAVRTILHGTFIGEDEYKIGNKMVFLKEQANTKLEDALKKEKARQMIQRAKEEKERKEREKKKQEELEKRNQLASSVNGRLKPMTAILEVPTPDPSYSGSMLSMSSMKESTSSQGTNTQTAQEDSEDSELEQEEEAKESPASETGTPSSVGEDPSKHFWDIFRVVAREQPTTDIQDMQAMKFIKFFAYVFFFIIVLASSTAQKVSFMLMVSALNTTIQTGMPAKEVELKKAEKSAYYILAVVAVCLPYLLSFITSLAKVTFGAFKSPSPTTWIWVVIMETLHTLGLSLLIFRVLPRLNVMRGLLLLSVAGVLPSLLKPLACVDVKANGRRDKTRSHGIVNAILDFFAFVGQMSVFPVIFVLGYIDYDESDILTMVDIVGALVFVSCSHWENFMDGRFFVTLKDGNWWKQLMLKRRFEMDRGRYITVLVTSVCKILATIALAYLFRGDRDQDYRSALDTLSGLQAEWKAITAIITLTLSGIISYYFAYIACKLWMQKMCYTIPLSLATPCAFLVFYLDQRFGFLGEVTSSGVTWPEELRDDWTSLVAGGAWWLTLLLLTRHVWFPRQSRLAKIESLFMTPLYCGILTTETLLLNRRRHTLMIQKKRVKDKVHYHLSGSEGKKDESDYIGSSEGSEVYSTIDDVEANSAYCTLESGMPKKRDFRDVPMIYACATMWHEVRREMVALLKSLHRLDWEQFMRQKAEEIAGTEDPDFFNYEAHVFFDDAMTLDDDEEFIPNSYVTLLVEVMEEAVSSVHKKTISVKPPLKIPTPYGGQLVWVMPGGNLLFVHMKDKAKIRHRKRWSQVMYMYYLLGFRLTRQCEEQIVEALKSGGVDHHKGWKLNEESEIFELLDENVARMSHNTFVMALDGDTDFSPGSVHILLDRMKKNPKVGAACGRIHPIGSGPMVWYQMFEYAIGHWMQKATEHVLGCVLCSPGCFSLFRGSALMDDNVMRKYTILPTEPGHFLQYDQGEDRWLCTLLLQQGYRVDYAAAADAWTYAPEGFNEFFNQRRRWMPSTLANVLDLLSDFSNVVAVNSNISVPYIAYQVALMVATILGPGTVLMMIAGAIEIVFGTSLIWSYVIACAPAAVFLVVCLKCKTNIQLYLAALLSTFYAFVMMVVFVGVIITAVTDSIFHPSVLVITVLIMIFVVAGIFHPLELFCLPSGILYLLVIPSGYLLLVIYSLANLHVVIFGGSSYLSDIKEILNSAVGRSAADKDDRSVKLLEEINENIKKLHAGNDSDSAKSTPQVTILVSEEAKAEDKGAKSKQKKKKSVKIVEAPPEKPPRDDLKNPKWIEHEGLGSGEHMQLYEEELQFWQNFIKRYLKPLDADKKKEKEEGAKLIELRNQVVFAVTMTNLLWMAINFMFQLKVPFTIDFTIDGNLIQMDILGMLFMIFLITILLLQLIGMFIHRWGTLLHLLAFTDIELPCLKKKSSLAQDKEKNFKKVLEFCKKVYEEPLPDYLEDDDGHGNSQLGKTMKDRLRETVLGTSTRQPAFRAGPAASADFANSPAVNLYLRATQKGGADDDLTVRDFAEKFAQYRDTIGASDRDVPNGRPGGWARNGGFSGYRRRTQGPPLPPARQNSTNQLIRRRNANNLRYTVKDAIQRAQRETGVAINPARADFGQGDARGGGGYGAGQFGTMDRAFRRRYEVFNGFTRGPGRPFETGIHDV